MFGKIIFSIVFLLANEALLPECIEYEAEKSDMYIQRCSNIEQISMEDLYGKRLQSKTDSELR